MGTGKKTNHIQIPLLQYQNIGIQVMGIKSIIMVLNFITSTLSYWQEAAILQFWKINTHDYHLLEQSITTNTVKLLVIGISKV